MTDYQTHLEDQAFEQGIDLTKEPPVTYEQVLDKIERYINEIKNDNQAVMYAEKTGRSMAIIQGLIINLSTDQDALEDIYESLSYMDHGTKNQRS